MINFPCSFLKASKINFSSFSCVLAAVIMTCLGFSKFTFTFGNCANLIFPITSIFVAPNYSSLFLSTSLCAKTLSIFLNILL